MKGFLKKNSEFWKREDASRKSGNGVAVVDMLVGHPGYMMGSAIFAKYLQRVKGCELVALVPPHDSANMMKKIAVSYGITAFIHEDDPASEVRSEYVDECFVEAQKNKILDLSNKSRARQTIMNFEIDGIPVGDLIYDIYMLKTGYPTIVEVEHFVQHGIRPALSRIAKCLTIMDGLHPEYGVFGHTVYDRYGFLCRKIVQDSGIVYGKKYATPPFVVRKYDKLNDFPWPETYINVEDVDYIEKNFRDTAIELAEADMANRLSGQQLYAKSQTKAFSSDKRVYSRKELAEVTNTDPAKPNVFVMSQCLSDAPHMTSGLVFDDYAEWLYLTAEFAKDVNGVNFIFKEHPEQHHYSNKITCKSIIASHLEKYENIGFCPLDLTHRNMSEIIDASICIHDVGIELAMNGIPVMNPGWGMTAAAGIGAVPRNRDEYFAMMKEIAFAEKLSEKEIRSATIAWYAFKVGKVKSILVPDHSQEISNPTDPMVVFDGAEKNLEKAKVDDDPLYKNFRYMVENNMTYMHDFMRMGVLKD